MTQLYFAFMHYGNTGRTLKELDWNAYPLKLLVSFYYMPEYSDLSFSVMKPSRLMLDSGAYSAWRAGQQIDIELLIDETMNTKWDECVALDVIGDAKTSYKNAVYMKERGSRAYPVFHYGEDWGLLKDYCSMFPKVGLSCLLGEATKDSFKFLDQCFARQWPHRFHSFGWVLNDVLLKYPFHSADTSGWALKPSGFGTWKAFNTAGNKLPGPRGKFNLLPEIQWYLELERKVQHRWQKEMRVLEKLPS